VQRFREEAYAEFVNEYGVWDSEAGEYILIENFDDWVKRRLASGLQPYVEAGSGEVALWRLELRRPKIRSRSRHSLRTLPTQRSAWAFAFGAWIGVRTDLGAFTLEDAIEGDGELRVAVVDQEARPPAAVVEIHQRVARLLDHPGAVGPARAGDVFDPACPDRDDEEHVRMEVKLLDGWRLLLRELRLGAGDRELKRRRWGCLLSRCLAA
jgi:hypothetical protein